MIEAPFVVERETKNTIRFREVDAVVHGEAVSEVLSHLEDRGVVGTLYVQKDALEKLFGEDVSGRKDIAVRVSIEPHGEW
jgi:hypothetical protein